MRELQEVYQWRSVLSFKRGIILQAQEVLFYDLLTGDL